MSDQPERRKTIRFRATAPIVVQCLDSPAPMTLVDLGGGGFSVRSQTEFTIGVVMRFRFSKPDGTWTTVLSAQTVYILPEMPGPEGDHLFVTGLKFMNPENPRVADGIQELIQRAMAVISFS